MFSVLIRDYNSHAAASCMNRLAKFRCDSFQDLCNSRYSFLVISILVLYR
jgi:hypothetical protein